MTMDRRNLARCGRNGTAAWLAGVAALALLAGCASDEPDRRGPGGGRPEGLGPGGPGGPDGPQGGPRRRPALFVSPAGEPFRSEPGEPYPVAAWFAQADADHDGKLTRDEFVADAARFFLRLDANRDGVVDGFEIKAYETEMVPEITEDRGPGAGPGGGGQQGFGAGRQGGGEGGGGGRRRRGGGGGQGGQGGQGGGGPGAGGGGPGGGGAGAPQATGAAPYGLLAEREPVAGADLDVNSRITLANFKARALQRFARLDPDGRGYLLLAELPKTQVQQRAERPGRRSGGPPQG